MPGTGGSIDWVSDMVSQSTTLFCGNKELGKPSSRAPTHRSAHLRRLNESPFATGFIRAIFRPKRPSVPRIPSSSSDCPFLDEPLEEKPTGQLACLFEIYVKATSLLGTTTVSFKAFRQEAAELLDHSHSGRLRDDALFEQQQGA